MTGQERRNRIISSLTSGDAVLSGAALSKQFDVSRQVIVQDIALLRANGYDILSTSRGYVLAKKNEYSRVFKVKHSEEQALDELFTIVDYGGFIKDVFVYHKVYNTVRGEMNIASRQDAREFIDKIRSSSSSLLMNVTSGYHYHTVYAKSEEILDLIQEKLNQAGFLAKLQDYEPVDFWNKI